MDKAALEVVLNRYKFKPLTDEKEEIYDCEVKESCAHGEEKEEEEVDEQDNSSIESDIRDDVIIDDFDYDL